MIRSINRETGQGPGQKKEITTDKPCETIMKLTLTQVCPHHRQSYGALNFFSTRWLITKWVDTEHMVDGVATEMIGHGGLHDTILEHDRQVPSLARQW